MAHLLTRVLARARHGASASAARTTPPQHQQGQRLAHGAAASETPIAHLTSPKFRDGKVVEPKEVSAEEAARMVGSGQRVFLGSVAATPQLLVRALTARHNELRGVELVSIHTEGEAPYLRPECAAAFRLNAAFVGANARAAVQQGRADFLPVFLSEVPRLFRRGVLPLDVALVTVSPPDRHGFCSLGTSVDVSKAAVERARLVIAEVNANMPRTHGDGILHVSQLDAFVRSDWPLPAPEPAPPSATEERIGQLVASLVENGACLQMGIGAIPNATLKNLTGHRRLGIHTEMFSDGMLELYQSGAVTNTEKAVRPGVIVGGFVMGSRKLYDFLDDNPLVNMLDISYVNDTSVIRQNSRATAINSAIEVDLTGQVCADSIGTKHFSGIGGQMDFVRGASLSDGGKAIIALPATTKSGESRIVATLKEGAGVVTTRGHVQFIVTEFGIAELYGKNMRQRAKALIEIAHPDHREALHNAAVKRFGPLELKF